MSLEILEIIPTAARTTQESFRLSWTDASFSPTAGTLLLLGPHHDVARFARCYHPTSSLTGLNTIISLKSSFQGTQRQWSCSNKIYITTSLTCTLFINSISIYTSQYLYYYMFFLLFNDFVRSGLYFTISYMATFFTDTDLRATNGKW
jgi:hypothetical protein